MFNYILVLVFLIQFIILDNNNFFNSIFIQLPNNSINNNLLINCEEFKNNVSLIKKIDEGVVKDVWLGKWLDKGYIAVSFLKHPYYLDDFLNNIYMLSNFTLFNSKFTSTYLGNCDNKILFTKYYNLGQLSNLYSILKDESLHYFFFNSKLHSKHCFQFCINYVQVINYLHSSPIGRRVMCDSNDLNKLLSQFLIDNNLNVIANDLDALPDSTNNQIKCGNRSLIGNLLAPEQLNSTNYYDEKIDIYKIPFVCDWLLSLCPKNDLLNLLLNDLHNNCLNYLPSKRPNSTQILNEYLKINYTLFF